MHGELTRRLQTDIDLPREVGLADGAHDLTREGLVRSRELYRSTMSAAEGGAKMLAVVAETTWGSTKLLNDKILQNVAANAEAAFAAAEAIAAARSLPEVAKLQSDYFQFVVASAGEQVKEFVDLSARVAQHVLETIQDAASRSVKPGL